MSSTIHPTSTAALTTNMPPLSSSLKLIEQSMNSLKPSTTTMTLMMTGTYNVVNISATMTTVTITTNSNTSEWNYTFTDTSI